MDHSTVHPPPAPLDLSHHFSRTTLNRKESSIKEFYKYFAIPGIGNLAGGLPNASLFPYDTLEASVALPQRFKPTPNHPSSAAAAVEGLEVGNVQDAGTARVLVPKWSGTKDVLRKIDVASALQYGTAQGYPPLAAFLRRFTREQMHPNVPYAGGPDIILSCGNTDGFVKALQLLSNEWADGVDRIQDRQGLLVEEFAYMNAIQAAAPRGLNIVPVAMDEEGMRPDGRGGLRDVLESWDERAGTRPHLMYTVTVGQNPTSGTLSVARRRALYQLCQAFDVIIIEDDPYWYLQYPSAITSERARGKVVADMAPAASGSISSGYDFLDALVPSYLSLDSDGRVVRLDTFSKTIAPGCRLGWMTAQPALVERILRITETSTQQPSGFVQAMVGEMILGPAGGHDGGRGGASDGHGWATDGWVRWLAGLRGAYERRMQTMCRILEEGKYLVRSRGAISEFFRQHQHQHPRGPGGCGCAAGGGSGSSGSSVIGESWNVVDKVPMYDFVYPRGGMFIWLELNLSTHPLFHELPSAALSRALWIHLTTAPFLVLVAPGSIFSPTAEIAKAKGWRFFRLCFAAVEEDEVQATSHRFVAGMNSFWAKRALKDLDPDRTAGPEEDCTPM
ncbi:MAG: hypothetical protein M1826_000891 [Phylliscum demangeonii]|nr:MAG: hypothetical protein M1826_000891 [Phylliscum demangeonii]